MMQPPEDNSAIDHEIDLSEYFVYFGSEGEIIPEDVTHVRVHSSVRKIKGMAFYDGGNWRS
jgi:hypothetical protein